LADGGEFSAELLLSLCDGRVLVVGLGGFDLGLDFVLPRELAFSAEKVSRALKSIGMRM
jgi:hypothetical protein